MQTALRKRLNDEQLVRIGRRLHSRFTTLKEAKREHDKKRAKYAKRASGDYTDRNTTDPSSIFSKNNIPTEFINGVAEFMVARTCEDIFGSDPYFATIPQGPADTTLADQIQKHISFKLKESRFTPLARTLVKNGYDTGEGIGKVTWRKEVDEYEQIANVLCVPRVDEPVTDGDGEYIHADDFNFKDPDQGLSLWSKSEIIKLPDNAQFLVVPDKHPLPVLVDETGSPVLSKGEEHWFESDVQYQIEEGKGIPSASYLCKRTIVEQKEGYDFEERAITERNTIFEGLDNTLVEHGDFVYPLNVRHIQEGDVFHERSLSKSQLMQYYGLSEKDIAALNGEDEAPKSVEKKAKPGEGEIRNDPENLDPEYGCIECYADDDVFGKGEKKRIFALIEKKTEKVLAIDYRANVTPQSVKPFYQIVPCPVPGRAYGRGYHEIYENETEFIDRMFNGILYRTLLHSNPPGFINESAFTDAAAAKNFKFSPGKLDKIKADFKASDVLQWVQFPDLNERAYQLFDLTIQMVQVRSGVTGAAQGALTSLPAGGTATGVQSIMMSGSTLHKLPIECVKDGFEEALNLNVLILYTNQDKEETFAYLEGDATMLITINPDNVKNLRLNVQLLLTRLHEREALESAKAAIEAVAQYLAVPEPEKDQVRPLFIQVLKALRITGADSILRRAIQVMNQTPPQQERFTESMNYKDAPEDIRRQMEKAAGYTPSTMGGSAEVKGEQSAEEQPPAAEEEPIPENAGALA